MLGSGDEPGPKFIKRLSIEEKTFIIKVHHYTQEKGRSTMLNKHYTAKLLGMEEVKVTNVERTETEIRIDIE